MAPSRSVIGIVQVLIPERSFACHLLSCYHLAPVIDMEMSSNGKKLPNGDPSKVQKRRCLACAATEASRPPVRTILLRR